MLSRLAAGAARELGYKRIKVFIGGFPEWASKGFPVVRQRPAYRQRG
ncbi:MAG: hypothetical protein IT388_00785 [Nitrospirales bacterium]|nr:hypothetical protein [Nitrospirales bacterium]